MNILGWKVDVPSLVIGGVIIGLPVSILANILTPRIVVVGGRWSEWIQSKRVTRMKRMLKLFELRPNDAYYIRQGMLNLLAAVHLIMATFLCGLTALWSFLSFLNVELTAVSLGQKREEHVPWMLMPFFMGLIFAVVRLTRAMEWFDLYGADRRAEVQADFKAQLEKLGETAD